MAKKTLAALELECVRLRQRADEYREKLAEESARAAAASEKLKRFEKMQWLAEQVAARRAGATIPKLTPDESNRQFVLDVIVKFARANAPRRAVAPGDVDPQVAIDEALTEVFDDFDRAVDKLNEYLEEESRTLESRVAELEGERARVLRLFGSDELEWESKLQWRA